ncbi:hypothetical protein MJO28_003671 [Puccinia striiformis f. sp. tritici]|uniref:Rhodanese domain-containing protein n=4 Tax=Puccinia striiformis f. sp. tritici TaxID=168172 RepID=A0A0L0V1Z3_9BASI|nr:hypothetical protein Pst134EA_007700 [Puccinia striiformis f. sp. tritici]XP_047809914.1 hypothetical protein Pst134EA_007712 [Puccinia striiformis f. sp. tritici]KAI9625036.1 hypothetical protein KEM48_008610 [Puccinia striiformis f. sp. tritici PST-130]KNE93310.1 hypothetical protein PSTG_13351 [Puccinia striiformis f. sp. tritici PST-78]KAH9470443.1 hypothetical protein Pst134EA_007700 [Puccinia striiformis f. sp. tritici]KAH9470460.1 hypothetical protein Pst134EA_007712 [Puccinia striif
MREVQEIIQEIKSTKAKLIRLQKELTNARKEEEKVDSIINNQHSLAIDDYTRYGRQMIVSQVGLPGQLKLSRASVLVIGAGGLGCPALLYLVRAGIGNISIVDHDIVELSNLHRQILHTDFTVGMNKAESAKLNLLAGNPTVKITAYPIPFTKSRMSNSTTPTDWTTYLPNMNEFTLVLDCTDNPTSRYLISDACSAYDIPLISGAAIRTEGQLSIWNLPLIKTSSEKDRGPCYRCIFPESDQIHPERCADQGVLGPTVGLVGVLMAWEAIRLLIHNHDYQPKLLLIPSFRTIKLRKAKENCLGCSNSSKSKFLKQIQVQGSHTNVQGYDENTEKDAILPKVCSMSSTDQAVVEKSIRITAQDFLSNEFKLDQFQLLDVRPSIQFEICALPNSINIPIEEVLENPEQTIERLENLPRSRLKDEGNRTDVSNQRDWLVVCRRGNDSLLAINALNNPTTSNQEQTEDTRIQQKKFRDFVGGLEAYSLLIDSTFPLY